MRIDLYIPVFNAAAVLGEVLAAAGSQTRPAERVIVIDDGSTDGSGEIARQAGAEVITHRENLGLAAARNSALTASDADILAGIDADVALSPDYLATVERAFTDGDLAAVCGNLRERYTNTLADKWRSIHMAQHYGENDIDNPRILYGSTTTVRLDILRKLGGWNVNYQRNGEDVDLTMRLKEKGYRTRYLAAAKAEHLRRDTFATVLDSFRNWFLPAGEQRGDFINLQNAARRIEAVNMGIFRYRLQEDINNKRRDMLLITCLLPLWMTLRDIEYLEKTGVITHDEAVNYSREVSGVFHELSCLSPGAADHLFARSFRLYPGITSDYCCESLSDFGTAFRDSYSAILDDDVKDSVCSSLRTLVGISSVGKDINSAYTAPSAEHVI
ncbi:MAG TPA: glycosyltransferase family 2 protein [Phycisphaeraceae bacterium]|nr:glycosyltransferase family 2 protein [Phycisphaeraceae bacterium]